MRGAADIADQTLKVFEGAQERLGEMFESSLRLGVTGLSRAGKTVFITALVANLLRRGRMNALSAHAEGRLEAALLRPQPDLATPRFPFEDHLSALSGSEPAWPDSTRWISQLRLSLRYRSGRMIPGLSRLLAGASTLNLDIVDYPGEWLLDLPLMSLSYDDWSERALAAMRRPVRAAHAAPFLAWSADVRADVADDSSIREGSGRFTVYLSACREAGLSGVAPGRFLMPGELEGSPALTFAPLPAAAREGRLGALMRERFEAYKRVVITPFFRKHFARLDRQIILVDALSALNAGPAAVADLRAAMNDILTCFRPGANSWLSVILGKRVDRLLFAATKADHIHHSQHPRLTAMLKELMAPSVAQAEFRGAKVETMAVAALRATAEQQVIRDGRRLDCVRGRLLETGAEGALYPGDLPENPQEIVAAADRAESGDSVAVDWMAEDYQFMRFAPPRLSQTGDSGPPHVRLDKAAEFLLADRLR